MLIVFVFLHRKLKNLFSMKKLFDFLGSLKSSLFDTLGFPTIKIYSDYAEVYFDCTSTIRDLDVFDLSCDEFRMFPQNDVLVVVFTIYFEKS